MKVRFKNSSLFLVLGILTASLICETWTLDIFDIYVKTLSILKTFNSGVIVPFVILQLTSITVKCSSIPHSVESSVLNQKMGQIQRKKSLRNPRFIKELTMMNRQSCLSKILCGVEVSQPPSSSTSTMNDYAYLVKKFFDQLSIQGAVKNALELDDAAEDEDDDISGDPSDLYEYKRRLNSKRPFSSYSDTMDTFHDEEMDQLNNMPLEDILGEDGFSSLDFKKRRSKMGMKNISHTLLPQANITKAINDTNHTKRGNLRFGSAPRYSNPRFDKTAFLNKKQLELGQANNETNRMQIAKEIAAKMRSPRQCRLLGWLRPSYTTTTTITTTSNNPSATGGTAIASSTCPFTVPELQTMILGSQTAATSAPTISSLMNLNLKVPVAQPIKKTISTTTTSTAAPKNFADYFDDEKNVGPLQVIPELDGTSSYYKPEDDEKLDIFGNSFGDLLPSRFHYQPKPKPTPLKTNYHFRPRPTPRPRPKPVFPNRFQHRPQPNYNKPRPVPIHNYGLLSYKPTPNPKLTWTTTTQRPWAELAFSDNLPQYSYKKPHKSYKVQGRPNGIHMDARLKSGLDFDTRDENSDEDSGEELSEEESGPNLNQKLSSKSTENHANSDEHGPDTDDLEPKNENDYEDNKPNGDYKDEEDKKSSEENTKAEIPKSVEESQESDEHAKIGDEENEDGLDDSDKHNNNNSEKKTQIKSSRSKHQKISESVEESEESEEDINLDESRQIFHNRKINHERQQNKTEKSNKDSADKTHKFSLPFSNFLSDHGRRTLSRISSLFNYRSKSETTQDAFPTAPSKLEKKPITNRPNDKRPQNIDSSEEQQEDQGHYMQNKRPPSNHYPAITPILIEDGGQDWKEDNPEEEEEYFEKLKKPASTEKPEKYDYDDEGSNESKSDTQEGVDFGSGQNINTEYSDIVSGFLKPGKRIVDQDRYVSGLPTSWENVYKEMKNKNRDESDEENNDDGNSEESDEDEDRNRRPPPPPYPID